MTKREKTNIWGPSSLPPVPHTVTALNPSGPSSEFSPEPQPQTQPQPVFEDNGQTLVGSLPGTQFHPTRKSRFGVWDAVAGFGAMIFLQVLIAIGAVIWQTAQVVSSGTGVEDVESLANDMIANLVSSGPFLALSALSMYVAWGFFARRASKSRGLGSYAKDFWLKFNWKRDITIAVVFTIGFRLVEQGLYWFLNAIGVELTEAGNSATVTSQTGIWFFINAIIVASLLAPFFEELFFRGLMMQGIIRSSGRTRKRNQGQPTWLYKHRAVVALTVSSVIFGFMHFQGDNSLNSWLVIIQAGILGLTLGLITLKTKRLGGAVLGHILFNFSGVMLVTILGG